MVPRNPCAIAVEGEGLLVYDDCDAGRSGEIPEQVRDTLEMRVVRTALRHARGTTHWQRRARVGRAWRIALRGPGPGQC